RWVEPSPVRHGSHPARQKWMRWWMSCSVGMTRSLGSILVRLDTGEDRFSLARERVVIPELAGHGDVASYALSSDGFHLQCPAERSRAEESYGQRSGDAHVS